ncbi:MAG TPA: ferredoxin-thioredoxin reductase catalytic domain-containing protein [Dissulfurispiraceae bacterium]|nr:ferredoxin-thioredoxin reductase catalytic domain-containing protein [Dissulfurispiraceae bacterium]
MTPEGLYDILQRYAASQGFELNADREFTLDILTGLIRNEGRYGYRSCPCRLASGVRDQDEDIICPCFYAKPDITDYGSCYCSLYVTKDWNSEKTPHVVVPERRSAK